jgi:hypothetical protein
MDLKTTGIVIPQETKLLIVGDSVMGCFSSAGDGDASPDALSYIGHCAPCSGNKPKPQCGRNTLIRAGSLAGPFLPATRLALPWAICKDKSIGGARLGSSERLSTSQYFRLSSENIGSSRKMLVFNALSKCSGREFSETTDLDLASSVEAHEPRLVSSSRLRGPLFLLARNFG